MPRKSDRYPDYEELFGYHYTNIQLGEILTLRSQRAIEKGWTRTEYLVSLLELFQNEPGTFTISRTESDRGAARFGRQVEDTPGHALFIPSYSMDGEAYSTESAFDVINGPDSRDFTAAQNFTDAAVSDEPVDPLAEDVLVIARQLRRNSIDREEALDKLFTRFGRTDLVAHRKGATDEGRIHLGKNLQNTNGTGLFWPRPSAMVDPLADLEPTLEGVSIEEGMVHIDHAELPEGGYVAVTASFEISSYSAYLDPGVYEDLTVELGETTNQITLLLFHGEPDVPPDFASNNIYSRDRSPVRVDLEVTA